HTGFSRDWSSDVCSSDLDVAEVIFYASNRKIISQGKMRGKNHIGEWKYYHKDGKQIMNIEHYNAQGQLDGESLVYYNTGQMAERSEERRVGKESRVVWAS